MVLSIDWKPSQKIHACANNSQLVYLYNFGHGSKFKLHPDLISLSLVVRKYGEIEGLENTSHHRI